MRHAEPTRSARPPLRDTASTGTADRHTWRWLLIYVLLGVLLAGPYGASTQEREMMVRIAEIEVNADSVEAYKAILKEEAEASVRLESGVIAIFPTYDEQRPTEFRILEIYASRQAYESHLKTPHFERYKTTTLKMVKSLKLIDMKALDVATMSEIFTKLKVAR